MSDRESIIEACKNEILYRAEYSRTPYDPDDLIVVDDPWGTIVLISHFTCPWTELQPDGSIIEIAKKRPNAWIEEAPFPVRARTIGNFTYEIAIAAPIVRVLRPDLIMLVMPDGTVKKTGNILQDAVNEECKRDALNIVDRLFHRQEDQDAILRQP